MEQMQRKQLENLCVFLFSDSSSQILSAAAFMRHSETLCRIVFPSCRAIKSSTLHVILVSCRALEILNVGGLSSIHIALTLKDAVESEWACTKIRHLEITISLTPDGKDPAYLADPTMTTWTEQDRDHWSMMDKLYTQIGALVNLEVLAIRSAGYRSPVGEGFAREKSFQEACLPGLLALEDVMTGQIGFLSKWTKLNKLQELRGSVLWTNTEAAARIGEREVEWFATRLLALRRAAFVNIKCKDGKLPDKLPRAIHELHRRRPKMQLDFDALDGRLRLLDRFVNFGL